jgi:hypothetical protein
VRVSFPGGQEKNKLVLSLEGISRISVPILGGSGRSWTEKKERYEPYSS